MSQGAATGSFCFAELVSPDPYAARQFYGDLFGWVADEVPCADGPYWLFHIDGQVVAGLRAARRGRQQWIPYVAVDEADRTVAEALRLGARAGQPPFDLSGTARMATIVDPHERVVGLWQPNGRSGADRRTLPGSMWRVEMLAHDVTGASHFYSTLFGWRASEERLPHLTYGYTVYSVGSESVAGAIRIERSWGRVPERWQVLFAVTDIRRTIDQTEGLGGCEDLPLLEIPGVGRCAALRDDRQGLFIAMEPQRPAHGRPLRAPSG